MELIPKISQQEKIDALKLSILAVYLSIPCLILLGGVMPLFGYTLPVNQWYTLFAGALVFNLVMHFCVSRKWLIGHLYHYLFRDPLLPDRHRVPSLRHHCQPLCLGGPFRRGL